MNRQQFIASTCAISIAMAGCATSSKDIAPAYVSPMQYQNYDCNQLAAEVQRLQYRVTELGGRLDQAASNDKAIMGVGLVLFWPALFALGGTKQQEAEYARIRGEFEALQQASVAKKCSTSLMQTGSSSTPTVEAGRPGNISTADAEKQMELLQDLRVKGIITEPEFETRRKALAEAVLGAGSASTATTPAAAPRSTLAGLRFKLRDEEPISRATVGEVTLTIDSLSPSGTSINGGSIVLDRSGKVVTGTLPTPNIVGLGGGRLPSAYPIKARLIPVSEVEPVDLDIRVTGVDQMRITDREISVVKCTVSGYAPMTLVTGMPMSSRGAQISGEIIVEPETGLVLSANIRSANTYYVVSRRLLPVSP